MTTGIKSLKTLTVDARKQPAPAEAIAALKQAHPVVEVAISEPGDKGPSQVIAPHRRMMRDA